jgi:hypothetical protein
VHKLRGLDEGTGDYWWKTTKAKVKTALGFPPSSWEGCRSPQVKPTFGFRRLSESCGHPLRGFHALWPWPSGLKSRAVVGQDVSVIDAFGVILCLGLTPWCVVGHPAVGGGCGLAGEGSEDP